MKILLLYFTLNSAVHTGIEACSAFVAVLVRNNSFVVFNSYYICGACFGTFAAANTFICFNGVYERSERISSEVKSQSVYSIVLVDLIQLAFSFIQAVNYKFFKPLFPHFLRAGVSEPILFHCLRVISFLNAAGHAKCY